MGNELFDRLNDDQKQKLYAMLEFYDEDDDSVKSEEEMEESSKRMAEFFRSIIPKKIVSVLNPKAASKAYKSIEKIKELINAESDDCTFTIEVDEFMGLTISLTVLCEAWIYLDAKLFGQLIQEADRIEIMPLLDEKLRMNIVYKNVGIQRKVKE